MSFKHITPGTLEWKEYWKQHPEEQNQMLVFRNNPKPVRRRKMARKA